MLSRASCAACRAVIWPTSQRDIGVSVEIGRFDHQGIGVLHRVMDVIGAREVAGDDNFGALDFGAQDLIRVDDAAGRRHDRFASDQPTARSGP